MGFRWLSIVAVIFQIGCATDPQRERTEQVFAFEEQMSDQGIDDGFFPEQLLQEASNAVIVGDLYLAIDYTKRAGVYTPQDPDIWYQLAKLYLQQQYYKKAEASALRVIRFSKGNAQLQAKGWRLIEQSRLLMGNEGRSRYAGHRAAKLERGAVFLKN